ncbi:hypothetical protein [Parachlamydia sp. AcF125]|uniref:hypothetical protein n=1 Tax=Parachlamydia sp. AcF125 TaxID=2795736 RepID=UPI001BCA4774|nr:hypothetical protein [Parachlamydia sp. AcF125]
MSESVSPQPVAPAVMQTSPSTSASSSPSLAPTSSSAGYSTSTRVDSLAELKKKAPKVYNAMIQGIATHICNEMKNHQDRLKKMTREASNS